MRRALVLAVVLAAVLCLGCPGERSPFCSRWLKLDDTEMLSFREYGLSDHDISNVMAYIRTLQ